ncbi:hypothetical protein [Streptomyces sp. VRA16 Mangrove soil]|uniref:hypothetical protein n=1 Tax=Streptomyces sp. VRA16 Mangrove soil TaxID=2817434 RepID=UPI001A9F1C6D|nr:hypothetical protein [Streptomyces sp. VRA16 Mangrove soil]MBO1332506.1 hypothetical protein [Streptomyces sp. VRA16 Mangrove soil]
MGSVTQTARNIETTAESLQEDLARLEIQKQALERELAAVTAHLGSVQRALDALQALMPGAVPAPVPPAPVDVPAAPKPKSARAASSAGKAERRPAAKPVPSDDGADSEKTYGKLTEQILAYFAKAPDAEVRARDVASALGRDVDSGSINAVRSTLDRLVGASRVQRAGRGLYRAVKP